MPGPNYAAMPEQSASKPDPLPTPEPEVAYPTHAGGGWYELSDGTRVQGKDDAIAAENSL